MLLVDLWLNNFRNYEDEHFTFNEPRIIIKGENGQGKSNLLEGVYFLSVGKSARGSRDEQVVRYDQSSFLIASSLLKSHREFTLKIRYDHDTGKKVYLDEQPLPRLSGLVGLFNTVLFSPEDVDLVLRFPAQRRRMLDILVSQASASYLSDLQDYTKVLKQRNKLLRMFRYAKPDYVLLAPWNNQLITLGSRIIHKRRDTIEAIRSNLEAFYRVLSASKEKISVRYISTIPGTDPERITKRFLERIKEKQERECELGYTLVGPHRDNVAIAINGRGIQENASKGQLRCILLSWKLAEASFLKERALDQPVLLLDDAFSELDKARSLALLELLGRFGQVLITSARDTDINLSQRGFHEIMIKDGKNVDRI